MTNNEIIKKIQDIIISIVPQCSKEQICMDSNLIEDLMFDSIKLMELVVELENIFDIVVHEDDLTIEKIGTFSGLYNIVIKEYEK